MCNMYKDEGTRGMKMYINTHFFLHKCNSEDNSSFTEILDRTNAKRREKYKWLLDKEKAPMLTHEEKKMIEHATTPATWKYTAKNALMYIPNGTGESLLNEADSRAPAKAINYTNTQFKVPEVKINHYTSILGINMEGTRIIILRLFF